VDDEEKIEMEIVEEEELELIYLQDKETGWANTGSIHRGSRQPATVYPNVANLCRGKTRQGASDVVARRLGQAEAYLTVRRSCLRRARASRPRR
jgi:hypothetical protein